MSFFQNPFNEEFRGSIPFSDRQYSLTFSVPANRNQSQAMIAWNLEPYDFSTYNNFTINFAIDPEFKNYSSITVDVAGDSASATSANEVAAALNADDDFSAWFTATVLESTKNSRIYRVGIRPNNSRNIRVYITNAGAEQILKFNKYAGVAELPTYFARHTIDNRFNFSDSTGDLILLDESDGTVDQPIITDAGFNYAAMKDDWELLAGRVGIFNFQKLSVDGSDRITEIIEYPAGAKVGDMARKTAYTYSGSNKSPATITQIPYTLASGDLITP